MTGWIRRFYIQPLAEKSGYNVVNSTTYAIIFALAVLLFYYLLKKFEVKINRKFIYASLTFVFWAATMRALVDCGIVPFSFFTVSPGIFLTTFLVFLLAFTATRFLFQRSNEILTVIGILLFGFTLSFWQPKSLEAIVSMLAVFSLSISPLFLLKGRFYNKFNKLAITSHFLDASTTFVGTSFFGYTEKFPLLSFLHKTTQAPLIVFLLKSVVLIPSLYLIDEWVEEKELRLLIKLAIIALGIATGFRGFLQVGGVC